MSNESGHGVGAPKGRGRRGYTHLGLMVLVVLPIFFRGRGFSTASSPLRLGLWEREPVLIRLGREEVDTGGGLTVSTGTVLADGTDFDGNIFLEKIYYFE